jgi:hypothetical protein
MHFNAASYIAIKHLIIKFPNQFKHFANASHIFTIQLYIAIIIFSMQLTMALKHFSIQLEMA